MAFFDEILAQVSKSAGAPQAGQGAQVGGQSPLVVALQEILKNCQCEGAGAASGGADQGMGRRGPPAPAASGSPAQGDDLAAGLNNLIKRLQDAGLDQVLKTWIGTGQNAPVAPRDLGAALGRENIRNAADQSGIEQDDLLTQLSKALPNLIDRLSPNGRLPGSDELSETVRRR